MNRTPSRWIQVRPSAVWATLNFGAPWARISSSHSSHSMCEWMSIAGCIAPAAGAASFAVITRYSTVTLASRITRA